MSNKKIKILIACKESAGDIFIISGVVDSLKKKYSNSNIYVATNKQYWNILENNPNISGLLEYHESMTNYRAYVKWAHMDNPFDIVYHPSICTQVVPMNWLNGPYACFLGDFYANACNVSYGHQFINLPDISKYGLPDRYMTIQNQSGQDPKNFDNMENVIKRLKNITLVQLGASTDKKIDVDSIIDLRGKTSFQEAASIIKGACFHLGLDSVLMHFAGYVKTPSVILFGGTLWQAGVDSRHENINVIEPKDRGLCVTSCHLTDCAMKQAQRHDKCINNISVERIIKEIAKILGNDYVEPPQQITLSAYMIVKDGIKYGFPLESSIAAASAIVDEVIVVDGGSTDGTLEKLNSICSKKIKILQRKWDTNSPGFIGEEKAWAAKQCSGDYRIQLDADEIIVEPYDGCIKEIISKTNIDCIDLPVLNFYKDNNHLRVEQNPWKFRIYKNIDNITHGPHGAARIFDAETMTIIANRNLSDYCEPIYEDSLEIVNHSNPIESIKYLFQHFKYVNNKNNKTLIEYIDSIKKMINKCPYILHVSWLNLNRKLENGKFWDDTIYGKKQEWHNTTEDIGKRIKENNDTIINIGNCFEKIFNEKGL